MSLETDRRSFYVRHKSEQWNCMTLESLRALPIDLAGWASFWAMLAGFRNYAEMTVHRPNGVNEVLKVFPWPEIKYIDHSQFHYDLIK